MSDKLMVDRIARVLGSTIPAPALLAMPKTKTIYIIAEAIAEEISHNKHSEDQAFRSKCEDMRMGIYPPKNFSPTACESTEYLIPDISLKCEVKDNQSGTIGDSSSKHRVCQHYNMTLNGICNDCGHKLTDEEWDSYPEGPPPKTSSPPRCRCGQVISSPTYVCGCIT